MEINKENYEAYLLDLWEGNLSEDGKIMLYRFLEENPELNENDALDLLNDVSIIDANQVFDKSLIKFDQININNHEFFFIAYAEGDLSKKEMSSVDVFVKENPALKQKFVQFIKAKLPLESIEYPNKEKLVFGKTRIIPIQTKRWFIGVVAASIVFLIWIKIPVEETPYLYTVSQPINLKIEKYESDLNKVDSRKPGINSLVMETESKVSEQLFTSNSSSDLKQKIKESIELDDESLANSEIKKKEIESQIKDQNNASSKDNSLINVSKLDVKEASEIIASVALVKEMDKDKATTPSGKVNQKIPTIVDLTAEYLQKKNILNEERKPDVKGIINSFSNVNENKKPIILIEEEHNSKTMTFELAGFKMERKKRK